MMTKGTAKPFLSRFGRDTELVEPSIRPLYDSEQMVLVIDQEPAIYHPSFQETGGTLVTDVKQETTDDR